MNLMKVLSVLKMHFILFFVFGSFANLSAYSATRPPLPPTAKVNQNLDFEGLNLEGELKAPGEFYFQNRNQERFDTLTKRRVNFRREMLRDSIQSN